MSKINELTARNVKAGFYWYCWIFGAGGGTKKGFLRHAQLYDHFLISTWY